MSRVGLLECGEGGGGEIQRSNKNRRIKFTFEEKTFRTIVSFPAPLPVDEEEEEEEEALRATPNPAPEPNTWEIRTIESRDRTNGSRNDPEIILAPRSSPIKTEEEARLSSSPPRDK